VWSAIPASCSTTRIRLNTTDIQGCYTSPSSCAPRDTSPQAAGSSHRRMSSGGPDSLQNDAKAPGGVLVQIKVTRKNGTMRNSGERVCTTAQVSQDLRLDERWGRSSYPKSKFSRILPALRESWLNSTWRTMAAELHRFVLGIGVILRRPSPVS
jgi:hypothetical protein